jgi:elongation factor Ts
MKPRQTNPNIISKNEEFQAFAKDVAIQVAAMNPLTISPEEVDDNLIEKEREIWREQLKHEGKKDSMLDNILIGKEKKFREESSLLKQAFVKDPEKTIEQLLVEMVNKMGENIKIVEFCRYSI